jgi:hypothetical protein
VCLFFIHFQTLVPMLTKFDMILEVKVLGTWKHAWVHVQVKVFPPFFLCKKGSGIVPRIWENPKYLLLQGYGGKPTPSAAAGLWENPGCLLSLLRYWGQPRLFSAIIKIWGKSKGSSAVAVFIIHFFFSCMHYAWATLGRFDSKQ